VTTFENNRNIFFVSPDNPIIHPPSPLDKNLAFVLKRIIYFPDNILTDDNINKKTTYVPKINRFILLNTNIFPYFCQT